METGPGPRFIGPLSCARPTKWRGGQNWEKKFEPEVYPVLPQKKKERKKPEEGLALAARVCAAIGGGTRTQAPTIRAAPVHGCGPVSVAAAAAAVDAGLLRPGVLPPPGGVPPLQVRNARPSSSSASRAPTPPLVCWDGSVEGSRSARWLASNTAAKWSGCERRNRCIQLLIFRR
jgi:hypothetical protein